MREAAPLAELASASDGRTRLRFAAQRGDTAFFGALAARLNQLEGVSRIESRPATGSVLIAHRGPSAALVEQAVAAGLFALGGPRVRATPAPPAPAAVAAIAFGALGLMQLAQNRIFPPAITLFWYAATLAKELRAPGDAAAED